MKPQEKSQAIVLRLQGLSYREIQQSIAVSRGSLHRWLRDITLTERQVGRIYQKNQSIRQKFVAYNDRRCAESRAQKHALHQDSAREIGTLTVRELHLLGAALYWAEGAKGTLTSVVEFVNTDPAMIALLMRWFRICCRVPESKFRARLQLHHVNQVADATAYWSDVTGLPGTQFTSPFVKISRSSQQKTGNRLPYGVLHIRIADARLLTKIQGWIAGLRLAPSSSLA